VNAYAIMRRELAKQQIAAEAADGRCELYKVSAKYEGDVGRAQHGFPLQAAVAQQARTDT
jgi:hypothetical protein